MVKMLQLPAKLSLLQFQTSHGYITVIFLFFFYSLVTFLFVQFSTLIILTDAETVEVAGRVQVLESGDLLVAAVKPNDAGKYTCIRANEAGSVNGSAYLTVLGDYPYIINQKIYTHWSIISHSSDADHSASGRHFGSAWSHR